MSDEKPHVQDFMRDGGIVVPRLCQRHEHDLVVQQLRLSPNDDWRSHMVLALILLFQATTATDRFRKRCGGDRDAGDDADVAAMNIVLSEIGCLACWNGAVYRLVLSVFRRGGFEHAAAVGKDWSCDADFARWMSA